LYLCLTKKHTLKMYPLYLTKHHAMKTYKGTELQLQAFLTLALDAGE